MIALWIIGGLIISFLVGVVIFLAWPRRYPLRTESDFSHHVTPWWQIYYSSKYIKSIKGAEKGSGLEEEFAKMDFQFDSSPLTESQEIVVTATGDLMCRRDLDESGTDLLWKDVGDFLFDGDLRIGNMEFAVNPNRIIWKPIRYSITPEHALPLLGASETRKFDIVSLANNHINDSFHDGIEQTCNWLDSIGRQHVGANRTQEEQDRISIFEFHGARIAVLAYTFSTNNLALQPGFEFGTNLVRFNALRDSDYDPSLIHRHIASAKEQGADFIISCNHWGVEHEYYPVSRLVERAKGLFEAGLDMIIGHHPHGLKPIGHYRTGDGRDCLCFYSLGNVTTTWLPFAIQRLGQFAGITLETGIAADGRRVVRPKKVEMMPMFFSNNRVGRGRVNRLLSVEKAMQLITSGQIPDYYSRKDIASIRKVSKEYHRYFLPKGVGCR
jgi:hypothetical protein